MRWGSCLVPDLCLLISLHLSLYSNVNEEWLWIMAVEWFYLLLKPLLLALVDHVVFTCFQV